MKSGVERGVYAASASPAYESIVSFNPVRTLKRPEGRAPGELSRCAQNSGAHLGTAPSERRSPTRQVLKTPGKRAGSEIGAPPLPPSRGQYQDAPKPG